MHAVTETLFVGNLNDAMNLPGHITGLLFVAEEFSFPEPSTVLFSKVPMKEFSEADPQALLAAVDWLERHADSNRLLVCCRAGMGRSVSVAIAYLCCTAGMSYEEAVHLLRSRRPGATPIPLLEETISRVQVLRQESRAS